MVFRFWTEQDIGAAFDVVVGRSVYRIYAHLAQTSLLRFVEQFWICLWICNRPLVVRTNPYNERPLIACPHWRL